MSAFLDDWRHRKSKLQAEWDSLMGRYDGSDEHYLEALNMNLALGRLAIEYFERHLRLAEEVKELLA